MAELIITFIFLSDDATTLTSLQPLSDDDPEPFTVVQFCVGGASYTGGSAGGGSGGGPPGP